MPLTGLQCGNIDEKYLLLPSDMSKTFVHKKYTLKLAKKTCGNHFNVESLRHYGMKLSPTLLLLSVLQTFALLVSKTTG